MSTEGSMNPEVILQLVSLRSQLMRGAVIQHAFAGPPTATQWTVALLMITIATTFGCSSGDAHTEWHGTIDTLPSGTIRVVNPADGVWERRTAWRLEEELRIGSLDGGPEEFGRIADLEVDDWGRIYVLLDQRSEIRVFEENGDYVRTIGRQGQGPGEIRAAMSLDIDSIGRLWVTDPMNLRYTVFDSSGTLQFTRPRHNQFAPFGGIHSDRVTTHGATFDADLRAIAPSVFATRYFRLDAAFLPVDTIIVPPYDLTPSTELRMPRPYRPRVLSFLDTRGYVWCAVTPTYRVYQVSFRGDTIRSVERAFKPPPISESEREHLIAVGRRGNREIGLPGSGRSSDLPSHKPALSRFFVDSRGYLWAIPYGAEDAETRTLDVFDPDGRYLGEARADFAIGLEHSALPSVLRGTPIVVRDDHLFAVSFDDLDVPYVVRARIRRR